MGADRADDVRACSALVLQQVHLFNATVRDNLAVADKDATDDQIEAACRIAQLHEAMIAFPESFETQNRQDGVRLSAGGERQRLAIFWAILRDTQLLVLDKASSRNLDVATESLLFDALGPRMAGHTTLVISHRRTVAGRVDRDRGPRQRRGGHSSGSLDPLDSRAWGTPTS